MTQAHINDCLEICCRLAMLYKCSPTDFYNTNIIDLQILDRKSWQIFKQ